MRFIFGMVHFDISEQKEEAKYDDTSQRQHTKNNDISDNLLVTNLMSTLKSHRS